MPDTATTISAFLRQTCELLGNLDHGAIERACDLLLECHRRNGRVYTMGNGGSASTAQHFACDLSKFVIPAGHRPFDARCLTDNVSLYTAWANDADRADVFVNLMRGCCGPGTSCSPAQFMAAAGFQRTWPGPFDLPMSRARAPLAWLDLTVARCIANQRFQYWRRLPRRRKLRRFIWLSST